MDDDICKSCFHEDVCERKGEIQTMREYISEAIQQMNIDAVNGLIPVVKDQIVTVNVGCVKHEPKWLYF